MMSYRAITSLTSRVGMLKLWLAYLSIMAAQQLLGAFPPSLQLEQDVVKSFPGAGDGKVHLPAPLLRWLYIHFLAET